MAGTVEGGKKAAKTNQEKHGKDFNKRIGAKGGKAGKKEQRRQGQKIVI